jgi:hypothetical protein
MNYNLKENRLKEKETCHPWCRIKRWDWINSNSNFIPEHNNCCRHSLEFQKKKSKKKIKKFYCENNCGFSGDLLKVNIHEKYCKKYNKKEEDKKEEDKKFIKVTIGIENLDSKNPYEVLGFFGPNERFATIKDIKTAYKNLSIKYHPDKNPKNQEIANENFKKLSIAYTTIIHL